jgi:predicted AAA+ superfamily ATPase
LNRYVELLTTVFLIKQIPAWSTGQTRRAIGTPKLAFVDAVLEAPDGRVVAIEVKAGATVRAEDLAGLRALPIDALWQAAP